MAPLASRLLPTLLQDPDWKKRHAALICISQIAEGCVKVLVKDVRGLADMCMQVSTRPLLAERPACNCGHEAPTAAHQAMERQCHSCLRCFHGLTHYGVGESARFVPLRALQLPEGC